MRKKQIILLVLVFMASMTFGYVVTRSILEHTRHKENNSPVIVPDNINNPDTTHNNVPDTIQQPDTTISNPITDPPVIKRRPSKDELTRIINNLDRKDYPRHITLKYENLDRERGEEPQNSIANIRNYVKSGVWESVTVTDFEYDEEKGKIISITLRINRNIEE